MRPPSTLRHILFASAVLALSASARGAQLNIVTDIAPIHSLVSSVTKGVQEPTLLLKKGHSPHHFTTRPSHARLVQAADMVVLLGGTLIPQLSQFSGALTDADALILLMQSEGTFELRLDNGQIDPHAWLYPDNAVVWVKRLGRELSLRDPDNAKVYEDNVLSTVTNIEQNAAKLTSMLQPFSNSAYLVHHDALGYFELAMNLTGGANIALSDARTPGAKRLVKMRQLANEAQCLFAEQNHNDAFVDTVGEGSSAKRGIIDPMGSTQDIGADLYERLLTQLASDIANCLAN